MLAQAVGIGIIFSLLLTETVGLAAGGIVVPGYIAYNLHHPWKIIVTIFTAILTWLLVRLISRVALIYGRRLLVISILIGYILGHIFRLFPPLTMGKHLLDLEAIGYVIPGLIAYWVERQGLISTLLMMLITASLVRLILTAVTGGVIIP